VLSLNHIFGTNAPPAGFDQKDPDSVRRLEELRIRELTENRVYGADILEVGYPTRVLPMNSFLRVWDALSSAGIDVVGNGISDTHGSVAGWYNGNNFVSWVWAHSASVADIVDGFRRGDVFFGDPLQFKGGLLTLTTDDGHRMGSVVITSKPEHLVTAKLVGLPAGARVRIVTNGGAGAEAVAAAAPFEKQVRIDTSAPAFVRAEAFTAEGRPLVFSNPIYFRTDSRARASEFKRVVCR
jgi:hypothetical protein